MRITLVNDFHHTSVTVNALHGHITSKQVLRAKHTLCGMPDCDCSDDLGTRGFQGFTIVRDQDNSAWVSGIPVRDGENIL